MPRRAVRIGIAVLFLVSITKIACIAGSETAPLWEGQPSLLELSRGASIEGELQVLDAQPDFGAYPTGHAMVISSLGMRTTLWGTPNRVTFSLMKNDVFDRRLHRVAAPTLAEITEGAFAPINASLPNGSPLNKRPSSLGYLSPKGGYLDPLRKPAHYPFPCPKPVGQVILGLDDFAGAKATPLSQRCEDGEVSFSLSKEGRKANLHAVLGMTNNLYAFRINLSQRTNPVSFRLYRHRDTSHQSYMDEEGITYTRPEAQADSSFNGPMPLPSSGVTRGDFWIRQDFPGEETFPKGEFHYYVVGRIIQGDVHEIRCVENKRHLGTPPPDRLIAEAKGSSVTATVLPETNGAIQALVVTVSSLDAEHPLEEAKRRLDEAERTGGFAAVESENRTWFQNFYQQREEGRVFGSDSSHPWPGESIRDLYRSWYCIHGGNTKPDMGRLQASAHYANPENDTQHWNGLPCYNEVFYTGRFVHHWEDSVDLWKKIVLHWRKGGEENARDTYGLPGMYLPHGYQPPTKGEHYFHTTPALELCLGTAAQLLHPLWDEWDYGGDPEALRSAYAPMRETAIFYNAYLKKGGDGLFHAIPSMPEENYGIWPGFTRNKDVTSAVTMMRWALERTAQAAELLGVDAHERTSWLEKASHLPSPWIGNSPSGPIFSDLADLKQVRFKGDHPWESCLYPVTLSDAVTLDSSMELRKIALRTATTLPNASTLETRILTGDLKLDPDRIEEISKMAPGGSAEALLNSRGGIMHFFPGVSPEANVAFRHFQARGGFLVSASHQNGKVTHLKIESRRTIPCTFVSPWGNEEPVVVSSHHDRVRTRRGESPSVWCFGAEAGETYNVSPAPITSRQILPN